MPRSLSSSGVSTAMMTAAEEPARPTHRGCGRMHEAENFQLLLRNFLAELNCRLDLLEAYGSLKYDAGVEYAWTTLVNVRDSCAKTSDGALEAGRRRAAVFVETLEGRFKDALETHETLGEKVLEGIVLMDTYLTDFETRAYALKDGTLGAYAQEFYEEGLRKMDEGFEMAKGVVDGGLDKARRARETIELTIEHGVQRALARAKEHGLIHYNDLPEPWRVNPHILKGYRFSEGKWACVRSVISIHNELINIWTHLLGFLMVLSLAFYFYPTSANFGNSSKADVFIAAVFFFAACKCLACSTIWHTMNSISHQTLLERFACVDYTGISLLVAASIMTTEYAAFYCEPVSRWTYMLITAFLGIGGVLLPWHPTFNRADMAWARVLFYCSLALTGFLPFGQLAYSRGIEWAQYFYAPITKSLIVYMTGACLYASKVPERFCPGWFDYVGCSHNIWHVAVLGGIVFHYMAMQTMFTSALARAETSCSVY
ncbi:IZH family channel protein-like protein [Ampelomyces quisqualis]|uniref:IZH family channel protein-like protein n=1 Tax=Ampelomyces quisqualis TaxID=50730 RepID=A0A6A5QKF7_AMPQU|nr:IZH family channel protein-like protein [Ampelomyces quisqualis]